LILYTLEIHPMTNEQLAVEVASCRAASIPDATIAEVVRQSSSGTPGTVYRLADAVHKTYGPAVEPRTLAEVVRHMSAGAPAPTPEPGQPAQGASALMPQTYDERIAACKTAVGAWQSGTGTPGFGITPVRR
jgi:hypothetical protein